VQRANFDHDRVANPTEVLDERDCELARAVADSEEVRQGVVVRGRRRRGGGEGMGEGLFEDEHQPFLAARQCHHALHQETTCLV
jgi:hypothetical protein